MKISHKDQTIERKNSDLCIVTEYPEMDKALDFAIVQISGRYPHQGCAVNTKCKEIVYVQSGSGKVMINDIAYQLHDGDLILIESNEKFYWEGNMKLFISCHPAFHVSQHQHVE